MAVHPDVRSLLRESIPQYLKIAEYCVLNSFGYPAAVLLFGITDTIGSFYRNNNNFTVNIDGKQRHIKKDGHQHFYILNSYYYGLNITENKIINIYNNFRSTLVHNASMAQKHFLVSTSGDEPFPIINGDQCVNLIPLLGLSKCAVALFLARIDDIVPLSRQHENIIRKSTCKT